MRFKQSPVYQTTTGRYLEIGMSVPNEAVA